MDVDDSSIDVCLGRNTDDDDDIRVNCPCLMDDVLDSDDSLGSGGRGGICSCPLSGVGGSGLFKNIFGPLEPLTGSVEWTSFFEVSFAAGQTKENSEPADKPDADFLAPLPPFINLDIMSSFVQPLEVVQNTLPDEEEAADDCGLEKLPPLIEGLLSNNC